MIKKTLYFGNPARLSLRMQQLVIKKPLPDGEEQVTTRPIEDLGIVVIDKKED